MSIVFLLVLLGIIVIIGTFMILYPKYYQRKVNSSFESGKPIKTIEPVYLYGGLLFLVVIIIGVSTLSTVRQLNNDISTLNSQVDLLEFNNERLLYDLWDLEEDVNRAIQQNALIQLIEFEVVAPSETDVYDVKLTYILSEDAVSNPVFVIESDTEQVMVDLDPSTARQSVILELDLHTDYTLYVEADGVDETLFEAFNLYESLMDRFTLLIEHELDSQSNTVTIDYYLENQWDNPSDGVLSNGLEIDSVLVQINVNGVEMVKETLNNPNVWSSHMEYYSDQFVINPDDTVSVTSVYFTIIDQFGIEYTNIPFN
jgi:hypothetical protein